MTLASMNKNNKFIFIFLFIHTHIFVFFIFYFSIFFGLGPGQPTWAGLGWAQPAQPGHWLKPVARLGTATRVS